MDWLPNLKEEKEIKQKVRTNNSERMLSALTDLGIAPIRLLQFVIKNLPWIALILVGCSVALICTVPEFKSIFVELLLKAINK